MRESLCVYVTDKQTAFALERERKKERSNKEWRRGVAFVFFSFFCVFSLSLLHWQKLSLSLLLRPLNCPFYFHRVFSSFRPHIYVSFYFYLHFAVFWSLFPLRQFLLFPSSGLFTLIMNFGWLIWESVSNFVKI